MLKQAIIPILVIAIIASIILPVPAYVMDFLLISNLVLAVMLLVSTLYISDPLKISSFPTILLLATLFRLALNISSTRLILSNGDAGQAIEAFGSIVIQDNIIVGAVVFLIITLVQFIVIAKGSERVAEVSARFTLDALPGKQMSIDADVRAGMIDMETARIKRQELQTESRFYGALDGSMKFVKGDAIAGIVICIVNIIGGFAIGVFSLGMELSEAIGKYSLLTIGDGLISQIPALLNALAAGLIVTRVTNGEGKPLASEVLSQLGQVKAVKKILGFVCIACAFLPGVPSLPVLLISALLFLSLASKNAEASGISNNNTVAIFQPRIPPLLQVKLSKELAQKLVHAKELSEKVDSLRQETYEKWGILILRPELSPLKCEGMAMEILMRGVVMFSSKFTNEGAASEAANSILNTMLSEISKIIDSKAPEFIDDIMTRRCLDNFDKEAPELVSSVVPTIASVTQLTFVLKALVSEGVPVRNFDLILQAVADSGAKAGNERLMLEEVRISLRHIISDDFRRNEYKAVSLQSALDLAFSKAEKKIQTGALEFVELVAQELQVFGPSAALVCSRSSRRFLFECLRARAVHNPVFAFEELGPDLKIEWLGRVSMPDSRSEDIVIESLAA